MKVPQSAPEERRSGRSSSEDFEWTWTNAVVFSLGFSFFCVITMAVIPSFWLYFAEQTLGWDGLSGTGDWRPLARDAVAEGLATGPFITVVDRGGDHAELAAQAARRLGRARLGRLPMRKV